jgi:hypothetical protein
LAEGGAFSDFRGDISMVKKSHLRDKRLYFRIPVPQALMGFADVLKISNGGQFQVLMGIDQLFTPRKGPT